MSESRQKYTPKGLVEMAGTAGGSEQLDILPFEKMRSIFTCPKAPLEERQATDIYTGHLFGNYTPPKQLRMPLEEPQEYIGVTE